MEAKTSKIFRISKTSHTPGAQLLDYLLARTGLSNDSRLADFLQLSRPAISKIRNGRLGISATVILKIHLALDIPVREILEVCTLTVL